jgi:hypothetical protein
MRLRLILALVIPTLACVTTLSACNILQSLTDPTKNGGSSGPTGPTGPVGSGEPGPTPGARDVRLWPFASTSIWNTPIGSNAEYVASGIRTDPYWGSYGQEAIVVLTPEAPLTDVFENLKDWSDQSVGARCLKEGPNINKPVTRLPIPSDWTYPHEGGLPDGVAAIMLADKRTVYQTQPFHRCVAGSYATSHYPYEQVDIYGDGRLGAHGGSGLSSLGGTIRIGELVPGGAIRHAMKVSVNNRLYLAYNNDGSGGFRWPARKSDGGAQSNYQGKVPALEMGALLALRADFDVLQLRTEPARIIATAFKNYGAYVTDETGGEMVILNLERGPAGVVKNEFKNKWGYGFDQSRLVQDGSIFGQDMAKIWPALQVVNNNTANNIGGGGTPRVDRAPEVNP